VSRLTHNDIARVLRTVLRDMGANPARYDGLIYSWSAWWSPCKATQVPTLRAAFVADCLRRGVGPQHPFR
jgi:hypothetical protein